MCGQPLWMFYLFILKQRERRKNKQINKQGEGRVLGTVNQVIRMSSFHTCSSTSHSKMNNNKKKYQPLIAILNFDTKTKGPPIPLF